MTEQYASESPREYCGIFGVSSCASASTLTARGLHALQHRGQDAAGIVSYDGSMFHAVRRPGLVSKHFFRKNTLDTLQGNTAIGHVRYGTFGDNAANNIQPLFADLQSHAVALCHNGQFNNAQKIRQILQNDGAIFQSTGDTEVLLHLLARSSQSLFIDRFIEALKEVRGGYALLALTPKKLIGARDPTGIRPLVLGKLTTSGSGQHDPNNAEHCSYVLASETCALDSIDAEFIREIEPGEVVVIENGHITSHNLLALRTSRKARVCAFEYIYFARPDSVIDGRNVQTCRRAIGRELARQHPANADLVVPIPDSGVPAALGYAEEANIPFEMGIVRSHYVGRTFIQPIQEIRENRVQFKHSPNRAILKGKRVVLVDDSIVRGTTSRNLAQMVLNAGATEVHFRIASPQIRHVDCYGINMQSPKELIAARPSALPGEEYISNEELAECIGASSVGFVSVNGLYRAIGYPHGRDNTNPQLTDHYFTGDYPDGGPEKPTYGADSNGLQLSLMTSEQPDNDWN